MAKAEVVLNEQQLQTYLLFDMLSAGCCYYVIIESDIAANNNALYEN